MSWASMSFVMNILTKNLDSLFNYHWDWSISPTIDTSSNNWNIANNLSISACGPTSLAVT